MTIAGITTPFRIATDAVRRCAYLRRETAGLEAAAAAARALKTTGAHFPSSVLGGELLDLMSVQFRNLIEQPDGCKVTSYDREALRGFDTSARSERTGVLWSEITRDNAARATLEPTMNRSVFTSLPLSAPPPISANGAVPAISTNSDPRNSLRWEYLPSGYVSRYSFPEASPPAVKLTKRTEPSSLITKKLQEYWDLERRKATAGALMEPATDRRGSEPRPSAEVNAFLSRSEPAAALHSSQSTFAQRLQTFVSGEQPENLPHPPWPDRRVLASDAPRLRTNSNSGPGVALSDDFAELLADTLSGQAIQHGIDLT